jgi:hypothetical protein
MRYSDLKKSFMQYHFLRSILPYQMGKLEFKYWNRNAKREIAALIAIWQNSGGLL